MDEIEKALEEAGSWQPPARGRDRSQDDWLAVSLMVPAAIGLALTPATALSAALSVSGDDFVPWCLAIALTCLAIGIPRIPGLTVGALLYRGLGLTIVVTYACMFAFPGVFIDEVPFTWRVLAAPFLAIASFPVISRLDGSMSSGPASRIELVLCTVVSVAAIAACIPRGRVEAAVPLHASEYDPIYLLARADPPGPFEYRQTDDRPPIDGAAVRCVRPAAGRSGLCVACAGPNGCYALVDGRDYIPEPDLGIRLNPHWSEDTVLRFRRSTQGQSMIEIGEGRGLYRIEASGWRRSLVANQWNLVTVRGVPWSWLAFAGLCVLAAWVSPARFAFRSTSTSVAWTRFCFAQCLSLIVPAALANWGVL